VKSLAEGFRVEASVLARLFRIKLLKLDATIVVTPSGIRQVAGAPPDLEIRPTSLPPRTLPTATGATLVDAVRTINEGAELLAEARRNGV
jgi:hypothetical protein